MRDGQTVDLWLRTRQGVTVIALIMVITSVLLFWWSTALPSGNAKDAAAAAAVALLTGGIVNVSSEFFLRKSIARDLDDAYALNASLRAEGLVRIVPLDQVTWRMVFANAKDCTAVVGDTDYFVSIIWPALIDELQRTKLTVTILAHPDEGSTQDPPPRLSSEARLVRAVESSWDAHPQILEGSSFTIYEADRTSITPFVSTGRGGVAILGNLNSHLVPKLARAMIIDYTRSATVAEPWLTSLATEAMRVATRPVASRTAEPPIRTSGGGAS